MFTKILVPIDGSQNSYKGLKYATEIARQCHASLTLIHIVERPTYGTYPPEAYITMDEVFALIKADSEKLLFQRKEEIEKTGMTVNTLINVGNPADEILKVMSDYDLVVMGSRGHSPLRELVLGSVSTKVVHHAKKPILIVTPD